MRTKPRGEEGATYITFDKGDYGEEAMPVEVCALTIAGTDRPQGLVFHLASTVNGQPLIPIFMDEVGLARIEACLRRARLDYPGSFDFAS